MIAGWQRGRACWTPTNSPGLSKGHNEGDIRRSAGPDYSVGTPAKNTACGGCGAPHRSFYDRKIRHVRDLSCGELRLYLEVEVRRVRCNRCGKVKQEQCPWLSANPFYPKRFAWYVGRRCREPAGKEVAKELKLDWKTVKSLEKA
jgi:transposase